MKYEMGNNVNRAVAEFVKSRIDSVIKSEIEKAKKSLEEAVMREMSEVTIKVETMMTKMGDQCLSVIINDNRRDPK